MGPVMRVGVVAALVLLAACDPFSDGWSVSRGVIVQGHTDPPRLQAPEQIHAGQPVTLVVTTLAGGCAAPSHVNVRTSGMVVTIEPYDREPRPGVFSEPYSCPSIPCPCDHLAAVTFPSSGTATIRIKGKRKSPRGVVERTVTLTVE
jgi:hypothetical protein